MGRSDIPNRNDWLKSINKSVVVEPSQPQMKFDNIIPISTKRFPLLGDIACGKPIMANEEKELYVEAGANISADFCLRAKGDSMIGARIYDGDIVFIQQQDMVDDGEIAAVLTHIRSQWGNAAAAISAETVAATRARLAQRSEPYAGGEELAKLP